MRQSNNRILIICGPTATGKTALGLKLAKKFAGEIISADSRQVYKGMNVGTGKGFPVPKSKIKYKISKTHIKNKKYKIEYYLFNEIPVWLLDIITPNQKFSVAQWVRLAKKIIKDMWKREKLPIVVGGTGFWIKALVEGVDTLGIKPNWELRQQLSNETIEQLKKRLKKLNPQKFKQLNKSDKNNPRRLVRAIEIASQSQKSKVKSQKYNLKLKIKNKNLLNIGLKTENYQLLYKRIDRRVDKRIKQGAQEEVEKLLKKYSWSNSVLGTTIGYKQWQGFFRPKDDQPMVDREKNLEEVIKRWKFVEHAYARRQMTWFKAQKCISWFNINRKGWQEDVVEKVKKWYSKN